MMSDFNFRRHLGPWLGGEPRVFAVDADEFPRGWNLQGVRLLTVDYEGGGWTRLADQVAEAAHLPLSTSFQAWLENLSELSEKEPLLVYIRHGDRLLADIGPALLHITTGWEGYVRHGNGVHPMCLVIDAGPSATTNAAFYPGGKVNWY